MKNIRLYQSSKYNSKRYKIVNFIYFMDRKDNSYCLPLAGYLEELDNYTDIINKLCEKLSVSCRYKEMIQIEKEKILLFELNGNIHSLIGASDLIGKTIIPIYSQGIILDLYIE